MVFPLNRLVQQKFQHCSSLRLFCCFGLRTNFSFDLLPNFRKTAQDELVEEVKRAIGSLRAQQPDKQHSWKKRQEKRLQYGYRKKHGVAMYFSPSVVKSKTHQQHSVPGSHLLHRPANVGLYCAPEMRRSGVLHHIHSGRGESGHDAVHAQM